MRYGFVVLLAVTLFADGGPNHQTRNRHFGVSGSNVNDISRAFCCGGTLGSLLTDGTTQYVLSNNHVLGRTNQAAPGEDVTQPGRIDNSCQVATIVADFTVAPPLSMNVDAAIAELRPDTMDSTGFIEDVGVISSAVQAPAVGLAVAKSGRTTGFTTGTITAVDATISVRYQQGCRKGRNFIITYTNQVVVGGSGFSAGGDSGSLIVANNADHNPVGLLYAGRSTTTIGNPIGEVLSRVSDALGSSVSFVGTAGAAAGRIAATSSPLQLPPEAAARAKAVLDQHRDGLMSLPAVIGTGVGASAGNPFEAVIVIYVDHTAGPRPTLPAQIDGIAIRLELTDPFEAL